jgi:spore germination protein
LHLVLVQHGDTLASISRRFLVTPEMLSRRNALPSAPLLLPGQSLLIPSEIEWAGGDRYLTYQTQVGDTPRSLAERWGVPLTWLSLCNGWREERLEPGEIVIRPAIEHCPAKRAEPKQRLGVLTLQRGLKADAAGRLHLRDAPPLGLAMLELDGAPGILPDVAKAILHSDHATHRLLDGLAMTLRSAGWRGVVFDWKPLRPAHVPAYLALVREAGRRLRPMGLTVGLYLPATSPLHRRPHALRETAALLDQVFFDPVQATGEETGLSWQDDLPPAPLLSLRTAEQSLASLSKLLPPKNCWLITHPVAVRLRRSRPPELLPPQQALAQAFREGASLQRDPNSALAWFRERGGEEGGSVWFEDLWSIARKAELLKRFNWQGLALWELGPHMPEVWDILREQYEVWE